MHDRSGASLVPLAPDLSCTYPAPILHLWCSPVSCHSRQIYHAPILHLWCSPVSCHSRQIYHAPILHRSCTYPNLDVNLDVNPLASLPRRRRRVVVHQSCTSRAPVVHRSCTGRAAVVAASSSSSPRRRRRVVVFAASSSLPCRLAPHPYAQRPSSRLPLSSPILLGQE